MKYNTAYKDDDKKFKQECVDSSGLCRVHPGHIHILVENIASGQDGHWRPWVIHWVHSEVRIIMFDSLKVGRFKSEVHDAIHR